MFKSTIPFMDKSDFPSVHDSGFLEPCSPGSPGFLEPCSPEKKIPELSEERGEIIKGSTRWLSLPFLVFLILFGSLGFLMLLPNRHQGEMRGKYRAMEFAVTRRQQGDPKIVRDSDLVGVKIAAVQEESSFDYPDDPSFRPAIMMGQESLERDDSLLDYPDDPSFRPFLEYYENTRNTVLNYPEDSESP